MICQSSYITLYSYDILMVITKVFEIEPEPGPEPALVQESKFRRSSRHPYLPQTQRACGRHIIVIGPFSANTAGSTPDIK